MKGLWFIVGLMICSICSFGQVPDFLCNKAISVSEISGSPFKDLEKQLKAGKILALRDVGTFLDQNEETKQKAIHLLQKYSIFEVEEIDLNKPPSREEWMNFYYENQESIRFSPLLHAYYLKPVEQQFSDFEIKKIKYSFKSNFQLSKEMFTKGVSAKVILTETKRLIEEVKFSHDPMEYWPQKKKLLTISRKHLSKKNLVLVDKIAELMTYFREESDFKQIVALSRMGLLSQKSAIKHLAYLSNQNLYTLNVSEDEIVDQYTAALDSLGSLDLLVEQGYKSLFNFNKTHFISEVDYYGKILSESQMHPYVQHNVLRDLIGTEDPVALFYIASQCYANRFNQFHSTWSQNDYLNFLEKLTYTDVGVRTSKGNIEFEKMVWNDPVGLRNFLVYWANRNEDFYWNEELKIFENHILLNEERSVYEVAIQQLNSKDEKVAFAGLDKLIHGEAEIVIPLLSRYEDLLKYTHPQLPSLKGDVLPTLILINDYCALKNIPTQLPEKLSHEFQILSEIENSKERFDQENKILSLIKYKDITPIELWAMSKNNHLENSLSADRIINNFYSKHWCDIAQSEQELSLFLKKMTLFGSFHNYLQNSHVAECSIQKAAAQISESDVDISDGLSRILAKELFLTDTKKLFSQADLITETTINELPPPSSSMIANILKAMKEPESPRHKHLLVQYFNRHITKEHRNILLELLKTGETQEWIVLMLEQLYQIETPHKTDKEQQRFWISNWKAVDKDADKLGERLWQLQFDQLIKMDKISANQFSMLSNSPYLNQAKSKKLLPLLEKFEPKNEIWKINFTQKLNVKESLPYFKNTPFPENYFETFPTFFEDKNKHMVIDFLIEKSKTMEQGVIFNDLVGAQWFLDLLESNTISDTTIEQLEEILNTYYDESDWLTEIEELNIEMNLFNLSNRSKSTLEKLKSSITTNISMQAKSAIQEKLLSRIAYQDLAATLKLWPKLSQTPELIAYNFVSKDFGISFFDLQDEMAREALIKNLNTKKPIDLYAFYLNEFGVSFQKNKKPDLAAINTILKNDLSVPFSASGGIVRDQYIFGLLKYLEFYYNDDLGFHPKLNENQTYYQYNSRKRAQAWLERLRELRD